MSDDFNGDGIEDLAIFYKYGGTQAKLYTLPSNGANSFAYPRSLWNSGLGNWKAAYSKVVAGDFNGSGQADMATLYNFGNARTGLFITR